MNQLHQAFALTLTLFGLAPLLQAETLHVGPDLASADFTSIQTAVDAAAPGDVILVQPGAYGGNTFPATTALVIDKSLTILGAGSSLVTHTAAASFPASTPPSLAILNLSAGDKVHVSGITFGVIQLGLEIGSPIVVNNCQGAVVLTDLKTSLGSVTINNPLGSCIILDSDRVILDDCRFEGRPVISIGDTNQSGLRVENSTVQVNDCTILGASGDLLGTAAPKNGGAGILANNSTLRISASTILGGVGDRPSIAGPTTGVITKAGPALTGANSNFHVRGGSGNSLTGGAGVFVYADFSGVPVAFGPGASAIEVLAGSLVSTAADVVLASGADATASGGVVTAPPVTNLGTYIPFAEAYASLTLDDHLVPIASSTILHMGGAPNSLYFGYYSLALGQPTTFASIFGVAELDLGSFQAIAPQVLDSSGVADYQVVIPAIPILVGETIFIQGLNISASGKGSISALAGLAIL